MVSYAVSPGRVLFNEKPKEVWCRQISKDSRTGVDIGFSISAMYSMGRVLQVFFSFGTEYKNTLSLLGKNMSISIDPVFTINKNFQSK